MCVHVCACVCCWCAGVVVRVSLLRWLVAWLFCGRDGRVCVIVCCVVGWVIGCVCAVCLLCVGAASGWVGARVRCVVRRVPDCVLEWVPAFVCPYG